MCCFFHIELDVAFLIMFPQLGRSQEACNLVLVVTRPHWGPEKILPLLLPPLSYLYPGVGFPDF